MLWLAVRCGVQSCPNLRLGHQRSLPTPGTPNQESVFLTVDRSATSANEPGDVPFAGLRSKSGTL